MSKLQELDFKELAKQDATRRNERNASYYRVMDALSEEELAKVRLGKLQVTIKDNVWQLVKKQEPENKK